MKVTYSGQDSYERYLKDEYYAEKSRSSLYSRIDSDALDKILSMPSPRKENELVKYLTGLSRLATFPPADYQAELR